jgi:hypothetical protein
MVLTARDLYHRRGGDCFMLRTVEKSDFGRMTEAEAEQEGFDPCPDCFSDE